MKTKIIALVLFLACVLCAQAQFKVEYNRTADGVYFPGIKILYDAADALSVKTTVQFLAKDVEQVTGLQPGIYTRPVNAEMMLIAGTLQSRWISELVKSGKIKTDSLQGQWERYGVFIIDRPFPKVKRALVVAGSDRRAVSFGLFSISEALGVSPWYWWADVPVKKNKTISLRVQDYISPSPSVKFRGIFINDEDWGLLPWAKNTFDPQLKDIGPKTYAKVFELLLRLKANYLCPAMHEASGAFNKYPENKMLADSFGIVMGSTHPEPLLFNNASEWDKKKMGDWNYMTNRQNIVAALDKRVSENSKYENVYTLALRGLHDKQMSGDYSLYDRLRLVDHAISDQRDILKKYINKPLDEIPKIFIPYKEVLELYNAGLTIPEDVTIVWPDDNYGYIKRLSNEAEQKRSGGSGVYYHASYLGIPHDYLWLSSSTPNLMFEELSKAYKTGANKLWLLNAGDIKSCEQPVTLFLQMAYSLDSFNLGNTPLFPAKWLSEQFGARYYDQLVKITQLYSRLAFIRKPEHMGWGVEWNSNKYPRERPTDTEFSFDNYEEAQNRLKQYTQLGQMVELLYAQLPEECKPAFYQLVYYPSKGAEYMNKKWLYAQLSREYFYQKRASTNDIRQNALLYQDSLVYITQQYDTLLNGKWNRIMSLRQGVTASYFEKPVLDSLAVPQKGILKIQAAASNNRTTGMQYVLPAFSKVSEQPVYFELYNTGKQPIPFSISSDNEWIKLSKVSGMLEKQERITVDVDWGKLQAGTDYQAIIQIKWEDITQKLYIPVYNPLLPTVDLLKNIAIETNGYVSIPAAGFNSKKESHTVKIAIIDELGIEGRSVQLGDPTGPVNDPRRSDAPYVEYDFYTTGRGMVDVYTYVLPTFPLSTGRNLAFHEFSTLQTRYGVCIDDGAVSYPSSSNPEYTQAWADNVIRNAAINKSVLYIDKPGFHRLKVIAGDPGLIIQKIVIDMGGMKKSYSGPPATLIK
ncbi:glycosyl hydrolase 115 family protein [Haoranjiania flava]|uniref:Glycosyl hydrolase 115 family protein n=1 Tax=Haoranjiania flava TaxID=1856322 RepID=A0AAE3LP67_9BACT|nr:glycosyl hydrolase 115 family protein [Haoranjiania flava]MCU7693195.1 glycosyl hydrolase 115 family protein [Haoranjiania flava]